MGRLVLLVFLLAISDPLQADMALVRCIESAKKACGPLGCSIESVQQFGTAVIIDRTDDSGRWIALTADHVVSAGTERVSLYDGTRWVSCQVQRLMDDVAVLAFHSDYPFRVTPVSAEMPPLDAEVCFMGYAYAGKPSKGRAKYRSGGMALGNSPVDGQSGGPVLYQGRLVGVISGRFDGGIVFTPMTDIQKACIKHWGFCWGLRSTPAIVDREAMNPLPPTTQPAQPTPPATPTPPTRGPAESCRCGEALEQRILGIERRIDSEVSQWRQSLDALRAEMRRSQEEIMAELSKRNPTEETYKGTIRVRANPQKKPADVR
ncbi:MAG: serine protease [Nitrospira sp.]|nr:serine protease [Nitrospira sp.]